MIVPFGQMALIGLTEERSTLLKALTIIRITKQRYIQRLDAQFQLVIKAFSPSQVTSLGKRIALRRIPEIKAAAYELVRVNRLVLLSTPTVVELMPVRVSVFLTLVSTKFWI